MWLNHDTYLCAVVIATFGKSSVATLKSQTLSHMTNVFVGSTTSNGSNKYTVHHEYETHLSYRAWTCCSNLDILRLLVFNTMITDDPIRDAQALAVLGITQIMQVLENVPDEVLLAMAELPFAASRNGMTLEQAPPRIKAAHANFRQVAKLVLRLKQDLRGIYPEL